MKSIDFLRLPMNDHFNIYIEQLRHKSEEQIDLVLECDFLDVNEPDLHFESPVLLTGEVYIADKELVFHWDIKAKANLPCSICNEWTMVDVEILDFYTSVSLNEIKSGVYSFKELLRETILLEVPHFTECGEGTCPLRKEFNHYLKPSSDSSETTQGVNPFADL